MSHHAYLFLELIYFEISLETPIPNGFFLFCSELSFGENSVKELCGYSIASFYFIKIRPLWK